MNELALFAGAGGGILGGKLLGWNTIGAVEIEEYPRKVLLQRQKDGILPFFPIWDDITTFDGRPWKGITDIVSGGFPCQDISAAGKGAGIEGERSGLWKEFARMVYEVEPGLVYVENSPMLTSRGLGVILRDLAELGYNARWCVLGGQDLKGSADGQRIWILAFKTNCSVLESMDIQEFKISYTEESRRRQFTRAISKMLSQDDYTKLKRNPDDVARGMDRLKAIGNGQVPAVAALAFTILSEGFTI